MITNDQKFHLRRLDILSQPKQNKKFNSKGYFHQFQPHNEHYLKRKHETFERYRQKQNKENFVYNLSEQRMASGYYRMKGCLVQQDHIQSKNKRRVLKTIAYDNQSQEIQRSSLKTQKIITTLYKKYIQRKERLKQKSERSLATIMGDFKSNIDSRRSISQKTSQMSEICSRVIHKQHAGPNLRRLCTAQTNSFADKQNNQIVAVYKEKIRSRKIRMKTLQ